MDGMTKLGLKQFPASKDFTPAEERIVKKYGERGQQRALVGGVAGGTALGVLYKMSGAKRPGIGLMYGSVAVFYGAMFGVISMLKDSALDLLVLPQTESTWAYNARVILEKKEPESPVLRYVKSVVHDDISTESMNMARNGIIRDAAITDPETNRDDDATSSHISSMNTPHDGEMGAQPGAFAGVIGPEGNRDGDERNYESESGTTSWESIRRKYR